MADPSTLREALLAEALGETARLIRQVEALAPALDLSRQALADAHGGLADQLGQFESKLGALTEKAKVAAMTHIVARTNETAQRSMEAQRRAMADTAKDILKTELRPALDALAAQLQKLAQRADRPCDKWLTHAAAASLGSATTLALATWLWAR
jgi:uncharacterized protein (DUF885 family)